MSRPSVKRLSESLVVPEQDFPVERAILSAACGAKKTKFYDMILGPAGIEDVKAVGNTSYYYLVESMTRYIGYLTRENHHYKNSAAGKFGNDTGKNNKNDEEERHDRQMRALKRRQEYVKTARAERTAIDIAFFTDAIDQHMASVRSSLQQAERDVREEFGDEIGDVIKKRINIAINQVCDLDLPDDFFDEHMDSEDWQDEVAFEDES